MRERESLREVPDAEALARVGADVIRTHAREAIAARGRFDLALAGGSTPSGVYVELARNGATADFRAWHAWFGDERCVPPDHPSSNFGMVRASGFLGQLPEDQVHRMRGEAPDPRAEAERYESELLRELGRPPRLDLVLLGLGTDGHTASLFPGTPALDDPRLVTVGLAPTPPHSRLTATFALLLEARAVVFLVAGPDKAGPLRQAFGEGPSPAPAHRAYPRAGSLLWLVEPSARPKTPPVR